MNEDMRMWMEIIFNVLYLVAVWGLVIAMLRWLPRTDPANRAVNRLFIAAFALLALGDTGHVGFRVLAYFQGDLNATFTLLGGQVGLVGLGALSTAITVTFFYVIMLLIWHKRFAKPYGWFHYLLFAAAIARLLVMLPAQNEWNNTVPPQPWSLYRNFPLMLQGLGVAYLILRDAIATNDRVFKWVGVCILISYAFYTPVILFVQQVSVIGMLMIPKTLAYLAIAILAYLNLFRQATTTPEQRPIEQRV